MPRLHDAAPPKSAGVTHIRNVVLGYQTNLRPPLADANVDWAPPGPSLHTDSDRQPNTGSPCADGVPLLLGDYQHMKYLLLIYGSEKAMASATPDAMSRMHSAYGAYTTALRESGVYVAGEALQPTATATSIRGAGAGAKVLDGPFAETKEQLGGFYMLDVPDLDAAIKWARRCPGTDGGTVEVRPVMIIPG